MGAPKQQSQQQFQQPGSYPQQPYQPPQGQYPQQPYQQNPGLYSVPPGQAFNSASSARYAPSNKNKRVIAIIIDGMISGVCSKLLEAYVLKGFHIKNTYVTGSISFILMALFYWVGLTLIMDATPGKKIMGLRIVRKDHSLNVTFGQLLLRETIGRVISLLPAGLGYLWVSWDKERRTFHDMISGTRVVDFR